MNDPINNVVWIDREQIAPNDYNPNSQANENFALLLESIRADGWTQPIVVRPAGADGIHRIVDGEHRWKASEHLAENLVPVVILQQDDAGCIAATVRHNRARGQHGVEEMSGLIGLLRKSGKSGVEIQKMLGVSKTERERLEASEAEFLAIAGGKDASMKA